MTEKSENYVLNNKSREFLQKLVDMIEFLIPNYVTEGKNTACNRNRMYGRQTPLVTLANELYERRLAEE